MCAGGAEGGGGAKEATGARDGEEAHAGQDEGGRGASEELEARQCGEEVLAEQEEGGDDQELSRAFAALLAPAATEVASAAGDARASQELLITAVDNMAEQLSRVDAVCQSIDGIACAQQAGRLDAVKRRVKAMAGRVESVVTRLDRLLLAVSKLPPSALARGATHDDDDDDDDDGEASM